MPIVDSLSKELFRDSNVFADAINGHFFHGEQIVKPESLSDLDPTEIILPEATGKNAPQEFRRDLLKLLTCKKDGDTTYAILGLEEQTSVDYSMASRVWLYDAMTLYREIRARENFNRKHRKKEVSKHFTSKLLPCDRVNAVITLVVYLSDTQWDGPRRISDLVNPIPEELTPFFNDYKLNLLCPNELSIEDIHRFKSDLAAVLLAAKYAKNPEQLDTLIHSDPIFRDVTNASTEPLIESICDVNLNHLTEENTEMGTNLAEKYKKMTEFYIQKGVTRGREEGRQEGIQEGRREGIQEGRREGIQEGRLEGKIEGSILGCITTLRSLNYSQDRILKKLKELYSLTAEQAMPYLENAAK